MRSFLIIAIFLVMGLVLWFWIPNRDHLEWKGATEYFSGDPRLISTLDSGNVFTLNVDLNSVNEILIEFDQSMKLSGFSVYFPGNLHAVSSYSPRNFQVFHKNNDEWILIDEVKNNRNSFYQFNFSQNKPTIAYKLIITKANYDKIVHLSDIRFFEQKEVSKLEYLNNLVSNYNKTLFAYVFYTLILSILIFIPGISLFSIFNYKSQNNSNETGDLILIIAPIISLILLAVSTIIYVVTDNRIFLYMILVACMFSLLLLIKNRFYKKIFLSKKIIFIFLISLLITNLLQIKRDYEFNLNYIEKYWDVQDSAPQDGYYGYHADNTMQWGFARIILNREKFFSDNADKYLIGQKSIQFLDRTPLLPLINVPILHIFGESHFYYQRLLNIFASLYYVSVFLIISKIFNQKIAFITSLLVLLSGQLTFQVMNTEIHIKYFATYAVFVAMILYFGNYLDGKFKQLFISLILGLGYLIHPMSLMFIGLFLASICFKDKFSPRMIRKCFLLILPTILMFITWFGFSNALKSNAPVELATNQNIYQKAILNIEPDFLYNKIINIANFFIPDVLGRRIGDISHFSYEYFVQYFLRISLVATITPVLFFIIIIRSFNKKFIVSNLESFIWGLGTFVIFLILVHAYALGVFVSYFPFSVPFLLAIGIKHVSWWNKYIGTVILLTFPLFNLFYLYHLSGIYTNMKNGYQITSIAHFTLISIYLLLTIMLIIYNLEKKFSINQLISIVKQTINGINNLK